jgi:nickel superoxide dismutase
VLGAASGENQGMLNIRRLIHPTRVVHAHCDLPCGIYDPDQARIEAESCVRILEKYADSADPHFKARCIHIKEERADLVIGHLDCLWHDYFKPNHKEQFPDLHDTFWMASKQASTVKGSLDVDEARKLLTMINRIGEMWTATGGPEKTRIQQQ